MRKRMDRLQLGQMKERRDFSFAVSFIFYVFVLSLISFSLRSGDLEKSGYNEKRVWEFCYYLFLCVFFGTYCRLYFQRDRRDLVISWKFGDFSPFVFLIKEVFIEFIIPTWRKIMSY